MAKGKGFGKLKDPTQKDPTQKDLLRYAEKNWDTIAAFAYDSYLASGKGVLIADWDLSISKLLPILSSKTLKSLNSALSKQMDAQFNFPLWYLPVKEEIFSLMGEAMFSGDKWRPVIDRYDPELMVVLAVGWGATRNRRPAWMLRSMALLGASTPRSAFEKNRGRLSEFLINERND